MSRFVTIFFRSILNSVALIVFSFVRFWYKKNKSQYNYWIKFFVCVAKKAWNYFCLWVHSNECIVSVWSAMHWKILMIQCGMIATAHTVWSLNFRFRFAILWMCYSIAIGCAMCIVYKSILVMLNLSVPYAYIAKDRREEREGKGKIANHI